MHNQRVETRSLFRFEDFCDRNRIERISRESVHGFRWKRYHLAFAQQLNRRSCGAGFQRAAIGRMPMPRAAIMDRRYNLGFHVGNFAASTLSLCFLRNASNFFRIASSEVARIAPARSAAFFAPASPIASVPTGIPPGICAVERSESRPWSFDWIGTPSTGTTVCAAITPAKCAAPPAPAIITRSPRSPALRANSAVASGVRWAESTRDSLGTPSSLRVSTAWRIVSQSDLLPITTATKDFGCGIREFGRSLLPRNFFSSRGFDGILGRERSQIDRAHWNDGRWEIFGRTLSATPDRTRSFGHGRNSGGRI